MSSTHTILDRDGAVLHTGRAPSQRKFIEDLVASNASFARAVLSGWPLNQMALDGIDMRDADLTETDLRGSSICGADFSGAAMRGARCDGIRAIRAKFRGADLSPLQRDGLPALPTSLYGGVFFAADFSGADLTGTNAAETTLVGANLCSVTARRTSFRDSVMINADFCLGTFVGCDFLGADLSSDTGGPHGSFRDRTEHTLASDNTYGKSATRKPTQIDSGAPAFARDRMCKRIINYSSVGVGALVVAAIASSIPDIFDESALRNLANGVLFIGVVALTSLVQDFLQKETERRINIGVTSSLRVAGRYIKSALDKGAEIGNLAAAIIRGPGARTVRRVFSGTAAEAESAGVTAGFSHAIAGRAHLIFCDRRHLALALGRLDIEQTTGFDLQRDLVMVREATQNESAPLAIRFPCAGGLTAVWKDATRGTRAITWDKDGGLVEADGFWSDLPTAESAKAAFETALWKDHGLRQPYVTRSNRLVAGRDGSIQIVNARSGRLNNHWGPAFFGVDGGILAYRDGVAQDAPPKGWDGSAHVPRHVSPDQEDHDLESGSRLPLAGAT